MRFLKVRADAFGPFAAGQELTFAPGMNVVFGANEAGKSSWHAALYAGLCGMRRGQGKPPVQDQRFTERHRPWGPAPKWLVTALVRMEDGVDLEFRQDLAVKSAAVIDGLGRPFDVPPTEGSPDGARLLGLDRKAFLATACVRQAELLGVREASDQLQGYLQRAVTSGGNDATVVKALKTIDSFVEANIGGESILSKKPLRSAIDAVPQRHRARDAAQQAHEQHLKRVEEVETLRGQLQRARHNVRVAQAKRASAEARALEERAAQAEVLQANFPDGPPPSALGDTALAELVATALASWRELRPTPDLADVTAEQLRAELAGLPEPPRHDTEIHPTVQRAAQALQNARQRLEDHRQQEPPAKAPPNTGGLNAEELRKVAFELRQREVPADLAVAERLQKAEQSVKAATAAGPSRLPLVAGGLVLLLGLAVALVQPAFGLPVALLGGLLLVWAAFAGTQSGPPAALQVELGAARAAVAEQQARSDAQRMAREQALTQARVHGVPLEPDLLEQLATEVAAAQQQLAQRSAWSLLLSSREAEAQGAEGALRTALTERGVTDHADPLDLYIHYDAACRAASDIARQASRRPDLEQRVVEREQREAEATATAEVRERSIARLEQAALACGVKGGQPTEVAVALEGWQRQHAERAHALDERNRNWAELQRLLGEADDVAQLRGQAQQRRSEAEALAAELPVAEIEGFMPEADGNTQVERLRDLADGLAQQVAAREAAVQAEAASLQPVSEAVEGLIAAELELTRVRRLQQTLDLTKLFLTKAQDRVQRDIAPRLKLSVEKWLPSITDGRYREVLVDPQSLLVRVRLPDGSLCDADLLSHGTAEQIYLLLRVTMAQHLTKASEVCPLILDDVTVQSDRMRTKAILETLQQLSSERQVILFTQEDDVLAWAEEHLNHGDHDQFQVLVPAIAVA